MLTVIVINDESTYRVKIQDSSFKTKIKYLREDEIEMRNEKSEKIEMLTNSMKII